MSEPRRTRLIALVLLGLGLAFRLWALPSARFTGDESYFWATARNIATFDASATFGPAMTGSSAFHPSPLFYYLMAFPQRLGVSPAVFLPGRYTVVGTRNGFRDVRRELTIVPGREPPALVIRCEEQI